MVYIHLTFLAVSAFSKPLLHGCNCLLQLVFSLEFRKDLEQVMQSECGADRELAVLHSTICVRDHVRAERSTTQVHLVDGPVQPQAFTLTLPDPNYRCIVHAWS
jgi:hypothetical protein